LDEINPSFQAIASWPVILNNDRFFLFNYLYVIIFEMIEPRQFISDCLGHSDIRTASHHLDSLSIDESFEVNNSLVKGKKDK
jgi:hypothetical protein